MGINKRATIKKATHKNLTKKEIAHKRVSRVQKLIENRKRIKIARKKKIITLKSKKQKEAQDQIIDFNTKTDMDGGVTEQQNNILQFLGLGDDETQWQKKLQAKLKEVNATSLDNPEVRKVYSQIGKIFSTYRSGKVPKAFKIIPNLQKWNQILNLTKPQQWTPQAMYQAVNVFASNFDEVRAKLFFEHYLAPAIRVDLSKNKKLNYHYFEALKKALYKTNAWFKGLLFQFCFEDTAMKQIKVFQALISKMTIPVLSSSVALIKLTQMQPCTAITHYLNAIISKHYNFPKTAITTTTNYLLKFEEIQQQLPIIWHQLVLNFVKQYKNGIDEMLIGALEALVKKKSHKLITPEILKALNEN